MKHAISAAILLSLIACVSCRRGDLRGTSKPSSDGKTYLIVADDNGGHCELLLDGKVWPHAKGEAGRIESGHHTLSCGGDITLDIADGVVYTFDYWGP